MNGSPQITQPAKALSPAVEGSGGTVAADRHAVRDEEVPHTAIREVCDPDITVRGIVDATEPTDFTDFDTGCDLDALTGGGRLVELPGISGWIDVAVDPGSSDLWNAIHECEVGSVADFGVDLGGVPAVGEAVIDGERELIRFVVAAEQLDRSPGRRTRAVARRTIVNH